MYQSFTCSECGLSDEVCKCETYDYTNDDDFVRACEDNQKETCMTCRSFVKEGYAINGIIKPSCKMGNEDVDKFYETEKCKNYEYKKPFTWDY